MAIQVVPFDARWRAAFDAEAKRLTEALLPVTVTLHHVGSTAIPGISAKPIIDILLEVADLSAVDQRTAKMQALGYEILGEFGIPGRRYFRRNDAAGVRTHQVHAFIAGGPDVKRHLAFRDYMVAHPQIAREYGELKGRLAKQHPEDLEAYMDGKDAFVRRHQAAALLWLSSEAGS